MITDRQEPTAVRTWSSSVTSERLLCKCRVPGLMITSSTNCRYSTLRDNNQYHGLHTDTHTQIHRHRYTDRQSQMINEHTCTHTCACINTQSLVGLPQSVTTARRLSDTSDQTAYRRRCTVRIGRFASPYRSLTDCIQTVYQYCTHQLLISTLVGVILKSASHSKISQL